MHASVCVRSQILLVLTLLLSYRLNLICFSSTRFSSLKGTRLSTPLSELKSLCTCTSEGLAEQQTERESNSLSAVFTSSSTCNHFNLFIQTEKLSFVLDLGVAHISDAPDDPVCVQPICLFTSPAANPTHFFFCACLGLSLFYVCSRLHSVCVFICTSELQSSLALTTYFIARSLAVDSFIGGLIGSIDCGVSGRGFTF